MGSRLSEIDARIGDARGKSLGAATRTGDADEIRRALEDGVRTVGAASAPVDPRRGRRFAVHRSIARRRSVPPSQAA